MARPRLNPLLRRLFRTPVWLYRWHCGPLLGHRFLLLTHIGRRSQLSRHTVLEVMVWRPDIPEAIVMSAFGRNADWLRNIEAHPGPRVNIGSSRFTADHRILDTAEAAAVMADYERRNRFAAPVIRLALSRMLGWRYRGSQADRARLAEQLPLVAFRARKPVAADPG
ncbi:MAG TPA: nitroreductase family deazaflavin-dependent oxidoreductase [Rhodopila sp.]|nr:nitroreductase family deazaflavin-dependent oxidoreductase [Rhodopila sp.]